MGMTIEDQEKIAAWRELASENHTKHETDLAQALEDACDLLEAWADDMEAN